VLALVGLLEERTAEGLNLIDQKGQHHQHREDRGQMLLAVSVVVLKMVVLIPMP